VILPKSGQANDLSFRHVLLKGATTDMKLQGP
jgi:hypothetical protein